MRLISINVGLPQEILWRGKKVQTAIFKKPVEGRKRLNKFNLEGDRQGDPSVHGGFSKAIYAYPLEHYAYWREQLPNVEFDPGMFGENFTTEGLLEECIHVGDIFKIGSAEVVITEPRLPCYKLQIRFGRKDIVKRFLQSNKVGFYFAVVKEGEVKTGDEFQLIKADEHQITIRDIVQLYKNHHYDSELLHKVIKLEALPRDWKERFEKFLNNPN